MTSTDSRHNRALVNATLIGTGLQVAMVVAGHSNPGVAGLFAVGGMLISLLAGLRYALGARRDTIGASAGGGALAGGICALIGIGVSYLLGDVPASLLALGTLSSVATGAVGGALGGLLTRRAQTRTSL